MKLKELIERLQEIEKEHGPELPVFTNDGLDPSEYTEKLTFIIDSDKYTMRLYGHSKVLIIC
jgi:hypothetical protein